MCYEEFINPNQIIKIEVTRKSPVQVYQHKINKMNYIFINNVMYKINQITWMSNFDKLDSIKPVKTDFILPEECEKFIKTNFDIRDESVHMIDYENFGYNSYDVMNYNARHKRDIYNKYTQSFHATLNKYKRDKLELEVNELYKLFDSINTQTIYKIKYTTTTDMLNTEIMAENNLEDHEVINHFFNPWIKIFKPKANLI